MVIVLGKYENEVIGNIVIIKNIIFKNISNNKKESDHSWSNGRPCLIIYSDNDWDYFLPIKSNYNKDKFDEEYFEIKNEDVLHLCYRIHGKPTAKGISGAINLQNVYKMPISGHDEVGKIKLETYKKIMGKLKDYHNNLPMEELLVNSKTIR